MKIKGLCGICPDKCWIEATVENGKLVKVDSAPLDSCLII